MGVVIPNGELQATFMFTCGGSPKTPTWNLGFKADNGGGASSTAEEIYNAFAEAVAGPDLPYQPAGMNDAWTFLGVRVSIASMSGPIVAEYIDPVVGTTTASALPMNCTMLLTKRTNAGGRRNRGRGYLPAAHLAESAVDSVGIINPTLVTSMQGLYDNAFDKLTSGALEPCVHHSDGGGGTVISSWTIGSLIATQRRRIR
jgi:hypothetical protein